MNQEYDYLFKMLLIGNSSVGKSSMMMRFSDNIFEDNFLPTIGVDFKIRTFELNDKYIKMYLSQRHQVNQITKVNLGYSWVRKVQDSQFILLKQFFIEITSSYYKGAHGVFLVYDVTNRQSFQELDNWLKEVEKHASPSIVKFLCGNKIDLENSREVRTEEGQEYAKIHQMQFIETSARSSVNIEKAFFDIGGEIKNQLMKFQDEGLITQKNKPRDLKNSQQINAKQKNKKQKCC